jgi:hypothetical protein
MKTLLSALSILVLAVACNKEPSAEYQQKQQEANQDYREQVNEAAEDRSEDIQDAREDLREEQKEEAEDYVDDSEAATVDRNANKVNVIEDEED